MRSKMAGWGTAQFIAIWWPWRKSTVVQGIIGRSRHPDRDGFYPSIWHYILPQDEMENLKLYSTFETWDAFENAVQAHIDWTFQPLIKAVTLHTDVGDLKLELFCEQCPIACENFLALCASGYYNNCLFHRNIASFMVQTGDPTGTGKGGKSIWGNRFEDEFRESLKHSTRGIVSMANNGPDTNGSQFFITYSKQPHLDMKYTIFGRVIDGFDALDNLEKIPVNEKNYKPLTETRLNEVTIHANPIADAGTHHGT